MGNALVPIAFPDASIAIAVAPLRELNVSRTNSSDFRFDPRTGRAVLALAAEQIRQQESMMRHVAPHRDGRDTPKKLRPGSGGSLAARDPVWDGEGWGCDRVA